MILYVKAYMINKLESQITQKKKMMALRFSLFIFIISLYFISDFPGIFGHDEDMTIKTMEEFSGYQIHEPKYPNSLSVNSDTLQKQVILAKKSLSFVTVFSWICCKNWIFSDKRAYQDVVLVNSELGFCLLWKTNKKEWYSDE